MEVFGQKKRAPQAALFFHVFCLLSVSDLAELTTIVGQARLAHTVGQTKRAALGAGNDAGNLQLPHVAATLVAASLGHFSLRNRHGDTSFGYFDPFGSLVDLDLLRLVIQQLRKRRQPWIYFGSAPAGAEVQVGTAAVTKTFAVF